MQGKKRYSRKINRKARALGRPVEVAGGLSAPPQALAENRWAGGRDALRLHTVCASPGGRKGAPDECSDWGGSHCPPPASLVGDRWASSLLSGLT